MSRLKTKHTVHSFRPRPIDVNQPLPIITDEATAREIDDEANLYEKATGRKLQPKRKEPPSPLDVDTPLFRILDDKNEGRSRYARPHMYIEYRERAPEEYTEVEYEVDANDELFMEALNGRIHVPGMHTNGRGVRTRGALAKADIAAEITDDQLEHVIDSFEKEAYFKHGLRQLRDPSASGILCCICNDGDTDPDNTLIFCNGCNTTVHQLCYGVPNIPHGIWLCRRCESRESNVQCILCNGRTGALKRTVDDCWVHVLCALFMPEVSFGHPETLEPVMGVDDIPPEKWNKCCSLCNESVGVCVPCDQKDCMLYYHVGCARTNGLYVEARQGPDDDEAVLHTYCKVHSLSRLDHYPRYSRDYLFEMEDSARVAASVGLKKEDFELIYSYWRMKRLVHPLPLLLRLRILSENGYIPGNTLSDSEYNARFVKLRQDFERARMLVDLVRKRELAKRQYVQTLMTLFDVTEDLTATPNKRSIARLS